MMEIEKLVRPHLLHIKPYSSARDEFQGKADIWLDANENPYDSHLNRYPDPHQREIKKMISVLKSLDENQILLCNGSDECIDLLIKLFCVPGHDEIIICPPTYGMYEVSASIQDVLVKSIPLTPEFELNVDGLQSEFSQKSKLLFLCSPNNPTGNSFLSSQMVQIINSFPGIVIIDEAYIDFSENKSWVSKLDQHKNLVVLQTFSKAWGLAGARVGMCFANSNIIQLLKRIKPPYNISSLSQTAIEEALVDEEKYKVQVAGILDQRKRLFKYLSSSPKILKIYISDANFLLIKILHADIVYKKMLEEGIVVRNRSSQIHCDNCLRISIGTEKEVDTIIQWFENYE